MRNINLYYDNVSVFKLFLIYGVLNKCVLIILLLLQSQEIYIQRDFAA